MGGISLPNPKSFPMESSSMFSSFTTSPPSSAKGEETSPDWKNLPRDVMVTILEKLQHSEVLKKVQFVCKSWHEACNDPAAWRVIHFNHSGNYIPGEEEKKYQKMAFNAVNRSCGFLLKICFEFYGNDPLLLHMAQISNQLRCLRIQYCDSISNKCLCAAIAKLPLLEEIELTRCAFSDSTIRFIGQSCPMLVSFSLNEKGSRYEYDRDNSIALAIAESMPGIHRLQLIGSKMTNEGLQALLDNCSCLKSLDIRACFQVDMSGSLGKRCADLMVRDDADWPHILIDDDSESEYDDYYQDMSLNSHDVDIYDDYDDDGNKDYYYY